MTQLKTEAMPVCGGVGEAHDWRKVMRVEYGSRCTHRPTKYLVEARESDAERWCWAEG
jgi:hypothetical protein